MLKTRLTQSNKAKHTSNANSKTRKERERECVRERERVTKSLGAFFLFTHWKNLSILQTLDSVMRVKN